MAARRWGRRCAFCGRGGTWEILGAERGSPPASAGVSRTPGRTRLAINFFDLHVAEEDRRPRPEQRVVFADLPGYRVRRRPARGAEKVSSGRSRILTRPRAAARLGGAGQQRHVEAPTQRHRDGALSGERWGAKVAVVATKLDRISRNRRGRRLDRIAGGSPFRW